MCEASLLGVAHYFTNEIDARRGLLSQRRWRLDWRARFSVVSMLSLMSLPSKSRLCTGSYLDMYSVCTPYPYVDMPTPKRSNAKRGHMGPPGPIGISAIIHDLP